MTLQSQLEFIKVHRMNEKKLPLHGYSEERMADFFFLVELDPGTLIIITGHFVFTRCNAKSKQSSSIVISVGTIPRHYYCFEPT